MERQIQELSQQGKSIRSIARALGLSRNTVRKVLRETSSQRAGDQQASNEFIERLPWQEICDKHSRGYTVKQLHADYAPEGLSYWAFNRQVRKRRSVGPDVTIPIIHEPGRTAQVDYADGVSLVDPKTGETIKTQLFCGVLPFSSYTFAEFTASQKLDSFLRSHERMFHYFGGVSEYVVHDNLKAATIKAHRYDPDRNPSYVDMGNHFGFATLPARPRRPRDKGAVEAAIGAIQRSFYQEVKERTFYSLEELNEEFSAFLTKFNNAVMKDYGVSRKDRLEYEKSSLKALPRERYEISDWKKAKVHPDCCIQVDKCLYSVPYSFVGQTLRVKITDSQVQIYTDELEPIVTHGRVKSKFGKSIIDDHYPPQKLAASRFEIHSAKRQAARIGPKMAEYVEQQLSGTHPLKNLRRVQGVLALAKAPGMTHTALEYAASQALSFQNPRLGYIKNCANQYLARIRSRSTKAPPRLLDTVFLHAKGD